MFRSAVLAAAAAARAWDPRHPEIAGASGCCPLCHARYRALVLDGPLRDLPHRVAHAAVLEVDAVVAQRLEALEQRFERDPWNVLLSDADRAEVLARRCRTSRGGLLLAALDELAEAHEELTALRRRYTEPALVGYLAGTRLDGVPEAWC